MEVSHSAGVVAGDRVGGDGVAQERGRGFGLREVDVAAAGLAGGDQAVAAFKRGEQGQRAHHAGQRVAAGGAAEDRLVVGVAREVRQARHLLRRVGEGGVMAPAAGQPEAGHRQHDQVGVDLAQRLPMQTEVAHHPRGVVFDDDVGFLDHLADRVRAAFIVEVEGDSLLVAVDPIELRRVFPETFDIG